MKKRLKKIMPITIILVVAVAVFLIGFFYFKYVSQKIYDDSSRLLNETYTQVSRSVKIYMNQKWRLLKDWTEYLDGDFDFESRKVEWVFEDFYFLDLDDSGANVGYKKAIDTTDSEESSDSKILTLEDKGYLLLDGQNIMVTERIDNEKLIFFAIPFKGNYKGFEYDAIAISYKNDDIVSALDTKPFEGKAQFFVIHSNGNVLFTANAGGSVYENYFNVLSEELDPETFKQLQDDSKNGKKELSHIHCQLTTGVDFVNGNPQAIKETCCVLYQSIAESAGQDYILFCQVPQQVIQEGFLSIQRTTIYVLITIFLIIGITVMTIFVIRGRSVVQKNKTELKYREKMFNVLSASVDDIFIMIDPESNNVDYLSPNVERLLGISSEAVRKDIREMAKCSINRDIIVPKAELDEITENESKTWECEYMHLSTGERRWYRVSIYHFNIGKVKKYIVVMSDRTIDRQLNKKLEEALNAAKSANEAKSNFLSNMSHDIRTPMNAIVGFSVLLEKDANDSEKVREYTRKIMASSHHLLSLINDVLDMSKIESGKTSLNIDKFALPELLEELNIIIMPQAKAKKQEFSIHVQGKPPEQIMGDKLRLNQILINLLSNAVKYTQVGGRIEFTITELDYPSPQYTKLRFSVKDNGMGMSADFLKNVFAPFSREINSVTNKIQGTGLGMAITKNLVDLMGGIINVESAPGKGSVFTVEMSFLLPDPEESERWYHNKITRMLVADDEEDICLNIKDMMHDTGVDVSYVTDGAAAVERAVKAHNRHEDYHVILLDWKMPGMDGVETAKKIRQEVGDNIPILVLTSYDWSEIETEAKQAGINAFMPKPFFISTFWQTIKPLFEKPLQIDESEQSGVESVLKGKNFLIAEDNELNAEILTEMLDMDGAHCELAHDGEEAVKIFEASEQGRFDMILMDVQMPIMNGYEATRKIRSSTHPQAKTIPIVAMTANTFAEDVRNAFEAGMDAHIAKPINMDIVRETVAKLTEKKNKENNTNNKNNGDEQ